MEKILKSVLSVLIAWMGLLAFGADDAIPLKDMWDTNRLYTAEMVDSKISQAVEGGDYNNLTNKPSIGGVVLEGNKTASALGLQPTIADYTTTGAVQNIVEGYGYATETAVAGALNGKQDKLPYATNAIPQEAISGLSTGYLHSSYTYLTNSQPFVAAVAAEIDAKTTNTFLRMEWDNHEPTYTRIVPMDFGLGLYYREWWETDWGLRSRWTMSDFSIWGDEFMTLEGGDAPGLWIGMDWEGRYQTSGGGTWYGNGFIYNIKGGEWSRVFLPKGIGEGRDNVMAITKDIDRATNSVVRGLSTAKWSLSNVTNENGGAVTAADVGAVGGYDYKTSPDTPNEITYSLYSTTNDTQFNSGPAIIFDEDGRRSEYPYLTRTRVDRYGITQLSYSQDSLMYNAAIRYGALYNGFGVDGFDGSDHYSVVLPPGSPNGYFAIESWASLSRTLNNTASNSTNKAACAEALKKITESEPHFAIIDGELHIISITETED